MQSHLEAALLGHGNSNNNNNNSNNNSAPTNPEEEDNKDFQEEEGEDVDEFLDEECDGESSKNGRSTAGNSTTSRTITLQMLLSAGILQPATGAMTIEYLGQKFVGDLLEDGKIRSQETDILFASPSAWAIACKRFINPDKKSGCGWASVKYKGKKLDAYKNIWYKKKKEAQEQQKEEELIEEIETVQEQNKVAVMSQPIQRIVVKHNTIANRTFTHDANTMIECVPFTNLGKIQPFLVSLSTNAALLMDFHCHLIKTEVSGYLAGHWDVNTHNLQISQAYPCRCVNKSDKANVTQVENEIFKCIEREKMTLVGWYHSHPISAAAPTLRDIDCQLDYQIKLKGTTDNSYVPCIGIIISPYNLENASLESNIIAYWVIPPPDAKPNEYGRPMLMSYSVIQDTVLTVNIKDEMRKCVDYYQKENEYVNFNDKYIGTTTYGDKLKSTLNSKFPRDLGENVWQFIKDLVGCTVVEENDNLLSIPSVSKSSQLLSGLTATTTTINPNLLLTSDIASVLFNSGKFPSATSLLGLPDPMAQSTLAANNMFLQTNLFKMQDLLKPLSTSSPIQQGKTKIDKVTPQTLKIPTDIKNVKIDYSDIGLLSLKNKLEYSEMHLNKTGTSKMDYLADLSKLSKEFSISDANSKLSNITDLTKSSISNSSSVDFNTSMNQEQQQLERPSKMQKTDFPTLDLSVSKLNEIYQQHHHHHYQVNNNNNTSTSSSVENLNKSNDEPMNLATD